MQRTALLSSVLVIIISPAASAQLLPAATAVPVFDGCLPAAAPPTLQVLPPVLGGVTGMMITFVPSLSTGFIFASAGPPVPVPIQASGCYVHVNIPTAFLLTSFTTNAVGEFTIPPGAVPNIPALMGVDFTLQAVVVPTPPLVGFPPLILTNGVHATFGV